MCETTYSKILKEIKKKEAQSGIFYVILPIYRIKQPAILNVMVTIQINQTLDTPSGDSTTPFHRLGIHQSINQSEEHPACWCGEQRLYGHIHSQFEWFGQRGSALCSLMLLSEGLKTNFHPTSIYTGDEFIQLCVDLIACPVCPCMGVDQLRVGGDHRGSYCICLPNMAVGFECFS